MQAKDEQSNNEKLKLLAYYIDKTINKAKELSDKFNIPYFIIQNKRDKMKETLDDFFVSAKTIENHIKLMTDQELAEFTKKAEESCVNFA